MEQKKEVKHIVYKITNIINGKIYIGQTKTHYITGKEYGIERRFKQHCKNVNFSGMTSCNRLICAIKSYGPENFKIEEILRCNEDEIDEKEIEEIEKHQSRNMEIGYNVAIGGKGGYSFKQHEEREDVDFIIKDFVAIDKKYRNNKQTGYKVQLCIDTIIYHKSFCKKSISLDENKKNAEKWAKNMKDEKFRKKYLQESKRDLPKNISEVWEYNKCVGYRVNLMIKGKRIDKSFQSLTISLDELLKNAKDYLAKKLENPDEKDPEDYNKKSNLPKNIVKVVEKGIHIGYRVKLIKNGVRVVDKMFQSRTTPLPELLEKAINYKNEYFDKYLTK
jgi:hypothetical protein